MIEFTNALDSLRTTGLSVVGALRLAEVADINEFLLSKPVYINAHVPATARHRGEGTTTRSLAVNTECLCVHTDDALQVPHLLERALALTDLVGEFLGVRTPYLYSTNTFWTRPGTAALRGDIQEMHVDSDDEKFIALFTYLTDVTRDEDGPHDLEGPDKIIRSIYGSAGTMFMAVTANPHRGRKPISHERGIHWFRWGVSERPAAYVWDGLSPVPAASLGDRYPADLRLRQSLIPLVTPP